MLLFFSNKGEVPSRELLRSGGILTILAAQLRNPESTGLKERNAKYRTSPQPRWPIPNARLPGPVRSRLTVGGIDSPDPGQLVVFAADFPMSAEPVSPADIHPFPGDHLPDVGKGYSLLP